MPKPDRKDFMIPAEVLHELAWKLHGIPFKTIDPRDTRPIGAGEEMVTSLRACSGSPTGIMGL